MVLCHHVPLAFYSLTHVKRFGINFHLFPDPLAQLKLLKYPVYCTELTGKALVFYCKIKWKREIALSLKLEWDTNRLRTERSKSFRREVEVMLFNLILWNSDFAEANEIDLISIKNNYWKTVCYPANFNVERRTNVVELIVDFFIFISEEFAFKN